METLAAGSSKAQMKIQQMAFMLVALVIFFSLAALIYFSFSLSILREQAGKLQEDEAKEIVRTLAGAPELAFTSSSDCNSCIDLDKALLLKDVPAYKNFWNIDYLMIEKVYPPGSNTECDLFNYPNCGKITIISSQSNFGSASKAFVTLVRWDESLGKYKYELGRLHVSGENIK